MRSLEAIFLGDPAQEPILFLHGFGTPPNRYLPLLKRLAAHYQVVAPDFNGDDLSTSSKRVQDLASHLHLDKYHLVAHSAGAGTALLTAAQDPRVIDVASLSGVLPGERAYLDLATGIARLAQAKTAREENRDIRHLARRGLEIAQALGRDVLGNARLTQELMRFCLDGLVIAQPTLVASADRDPFFPMTEQAEKALAGVCRDLRVMTVADADHEWPWIEPDRAYGILLHFYDEAHGQAPR